MLIDKDPTRKIINNLKSLLKRWKSREIISEYTFRSLRCNDGVLPRAYGLPKIHKENWPLRIIISSINCPLYPLVSFLHKCLYDNLPKPQSHVSNSFELVKQLNGLHLDDCFDLLSLDVVSLFTKSSFRFSH